VRVGRAVYLRAPTGQRWILGVWRPEDAPPAWADKLDAWHPRRVSDPLPGVVRRRLERESQERRRWRLRDWGPEGRGRWIGRPGHGRVPGDLVVDRAGYVAWPPDHPWTRANLPDTREWYRRSGRYRDEARRRARQAARP